MSTQDYIVMQLVAPAPRTQRGFTFGTLDAATVPPQATVSVEALTPGDVARARRAPGVMVAPPMPIKLVAPLAVAEPVDAGAAAANETWGVAAVGAPGSSVTGAGVKVAVLDTGIDAAHPAFANLAVTQRDFTGEGDGDTHGHGTHCAGTIAGADVGGLRIGIARGLGELLIGKVLGDQGGSTASIVEAMNWAGEQGANVISMSLGIDFAGAVNDLVQQQGLPIQAATSWALQAYRDNVRVFESAASLLTTSAQLDNRAIVVVAASGNESQRPQYTIDVSPPAASTGFVKVAAVGQGAGGALQIAPFSNTGVDVAGPGVNVISAKPGGGTQAMSGTSMATPHAAGVAALWAEKLGVQATSGMLRAHLEGQAQAIQGMGASDVGSGLVHAPS